MSTEGEDAALPLHMRSEHTSVAPEAGVGEKVLRMRVVSLAHRAGSRLPLSAQSSETPRCDSPWESVLLSLLLGANPHSVGGGRWTQRTTPLPSLELHSRP